MIGKDQIASVRALSPAQKGMFLEHTFSNKPGMQVEQTVWHFTGSIDPETITRTWKALMDRYETLRTTFVWGRAETPHQVVLKELEPPIECHNWTSHSDAEKERLFHTLLDEDRRQGFELNAPPLMRIYLLQMADREWKMIWTHHHILLDGWSVALIIKDLVEWYEDQTNADFSLKTGGPSLGSYLGWLHQQPVQEAADFWKNHLGNQALPSATGAEHAMPELSESGYGEASSFIPEGIWQPLMSRARSTGNTPANVVQGIWSALLAVYNEMHPVQYGLTVSGRPQALPHSDRIAGLLINSIPVRIKPKMEMSFEQLLHVIRDVRLDQQTYEQYTTGQIHEWSGMPAYLPLYNHLLVYENYPFDETALGNRYFALDRSKSEYSGARTNLPLTLMFTGGGQLRIDAVYKQPGWDGENISRLLSQYKMAAGLFMENPAATLGELGSMIPGTEYPRYGRTYALPDEKLPSTGSGGWDESPMKQQVRAVFEEVLERPMNDENPNFYAMGGHSLMAGKVHARLCRRLELEFPLRAIFEHPDLERLAAYLEQQVQHSNGPETVRMEEGEI